MSKKAAEESAVDLATSYGNEQARASDPNKGKETSTQDKPTELP